MFTEKVRKKTIPYWEGSFSHPFIVELQKGSLDSDVFRYYLIQDRYYLEHFSKLHILLAETAADKKIRDMLLSGAKHLADGELMIREEFFSELRITDEEIAKTPIAPTAYHYVSHMYRQLTDGTMNSALAGLLPCAWLYQEIGGHLATGGSPHPLYDRWIETYAGEDSAQEVRRQCSLLNTLYEHSDAVEQHQMTEAFVISAKMEFLFWEMAYTLQTWPEGDHHAVPFR